MAIDDNKVLNPKSESLVLSEIDLKNFSRTKGLEYACTDLSDLDKFGGKFTFVHTGSEKNQFNGGNTDHWMFLGGDKIFDSYGLQEDFLFPSWVKYVELRPKRLQEYGTKVCGEYCCIFFEFMHQHDDQNDDNIGLEFCDYYGFSEARAENDRIVQQVYKDEGGHYGADYGGDIEEMGGAVKKPRKMFNSEYLSKIKQYNNILDRMAEDKVVSRLEYRRYRTASMEFLPKNKHFQRLLREHYPTHPLVQENFKMPPQYIDVEEPAVDPDLEPDEESDVEEVTAEPDTTTPAPGGAPAPAPPGTTTPAPPVPTTPSPIPPVPTPVPHPVPSPVPLPAPVPAPGPIPGTPVPPIPFPYPVPAPAPGPVPAHPPGTSPAPFPLIPTPAPSPMSTPIVQVPEPFVGTSPNVAVIPGSDLATPEAMKTLMQTITPSIPLDQQFLHPTIPKQALQPFMPNPRSFINGAVQQMATPERTAAKRLHYDGTVNSNFKKAKGTVQALQQVQSFVPWINLEEDADEAIAFQTPQITQQTNVPQTLVIERGLLKAATNKL